MEKLILNKDTSIVLPQFDTSGILEEHVQNIILHLYLSDFHSQTRKQKIHLTINLFNEKTNDFEDGISVFIEPKINTYIGFSLPKELFQKMLVSHSRLLIMMVDKDAQMIFEGPETLDAGKDPYLDITAFGKGVSSDKYMVNYNFYNMNNSQIHYGIGDNILANKNSDNKIVSLNKKNWLNHPWTIDVFGGLFVVIVGGLILHRLISSEKGKSQEEDQPSVRQQHYGIGDNVVGDKITINKGASSLSGVLLPNNKPTPLNSGKIPSNAVAIFLGNSVAYSSRFPHTVIQVGRQDLLIINKEGDKITVSAKFFSRDNKIVAELKENKFYINPNNYFREERPNDHTLIVYDQEAQEVLNIEFINPKVIKLLGIFYFPNRPPIIIKDNVQILGGIQMSNNCFGENNVDIHLD